jgi:hypothetical protein
MTKIVGQGLILAAACALLLQGCATHPITTDALPPLKPGEGIAGISFDSLRALQKVRFDDAAGNQKLLIDHVPFGQSAFLFVVPAGRYCIERYTIDEHGYAIETPPDDRCFAVEAGKLSYSGTFVPDLNPGETPGTAPYLPGMTRKDRPHAFLNALSLNYPHIAAAAFPTGSDRSIAELAPRGPPPSGNVCSLLTQEEAAAVLAKPVEAASEFFVAPIDACNFKHSDDESVHVLVYGGDDRSSQFTGPGFEASATGASDWTPIPFLGEKAAFGCKKDNCEIDILWQGQVLVLVVDGNDRKDITEALTTLARKVFPRWQANPTIGTPTNPAQL